MTDMKEFLLKAMAAKKLKTAGVGPDAADQQITHEQPVTVKQVVKQVAHVVEPQEQSTQTPQKKRGRPPVGETRMSDVEYNRRYRAKKQKG